jgi:hypothetical protein
MFLDNISEPRCRPCPHLYQATYLRQRLGSVKTAIGVEMDLELYRLRPRLHGSETAARK